MKVFGEKVVILLVIYLSILLFVARFMDLVTWCVTDGRWSRDSTDPMSLSVMQLNAVLEWRAVPSERPQDKSHLVRLVTQSGPINAMEEAVLEQLRERPVSSTVEFKSYLQYYQRVENRNITDDTYWLVLVQAAGDHGNGPLIQHKMPCSSEATRSQEYWTDVFPELRLLGVKTGFFDCRLDPERCKQRQWTTTRLMFVFLHAFGKVAIHEYSDMLALEGVKLWMREILDSKLPYFRFYYGENKLLSVQANEMLIHWNHEVRAEINTIHDSLPIQFFVLGVGGIPRLQFFVIQDVYNSGFHWRKGENVSPNISLPYICFSCKEGYCEYGRSAKECFDKSCIATFLKFWCPSSMHVYAATAVFVLLLALLDGFPLTWDSVQEAFSNAMAIITLGFGLCVLFFEKDQYISIVRKMTSSTFASIFRTDFIFCFHHPNLLLVVSLLVFCLLQRIAKFLGYRSDTPVARALDAERRQRFLEYVSANSHFQREIVAEYRRARSHEEARLREMIHQQEEMQRRIDGFLAAERNLFYNGQRPPANYVDDLPTWRHNLNSCGGPNLADGASEGKLPQGNKPDSGDTEREGYDHDGEGFIGCDRCVICQFDVEQGEDVCGLPCRHAFHATCIRQWLSTGQHACPVCRRSSF